MDNPKEKNNSTMLISENSNKKSQQPKSVMRDIILGKKRIKALPDNFFERLIDLELTIRREFSMETLNEIVYLYSIAIEYYESIEEKKYKEYQNRLSLLLSHPDILKKMNDHIQLRRVKSQSQCSNKQSLDYFEKVKKDQEKIQIKMKVDFMTQLSSLEKTEEHVQKLLETIEKQNGVSGARTKVQEEINRQEESFKEKLEQKRARTFYTKNGTKLSSKFVSKCTIDEKMESKNQSDSNLNSNDDGNKDNADGNNSEEKIEEENKIQIKIIREEHSFSGESIGGGSRDENEDEDEKKFNDKDIIPVKFDSEKAEKSRLRLPLMTPLKKINSSNENTVEMDSNSNRGECRSVDPSPRRNNKEIIATMFQYNESISESKHIGPKHKQAFLEIKEAIDQFVNEFNLYFYDQVYRRFAEQIQKLMDEKYQKYIEISKNYNSQIKEMEFLIAGDIDDQQKEKFKVIIDSLKEEKENELDNIEEHYNMIILNTQSEFKNTGFKTNSGVQLLEEKFKLDMYNLINGILIPKK